MTIDYFLDQYSFFEWNWFVLDEMIRFVHMNTFGVESS